MSDNPGFGSRLFVSGALAFVLIGLLGAVYGVALPAFARNFGLGLGEAGTILSTHAAGGVLAVLGLTFGLRGLGARTASALISVGTAPIALSLGWVATLAGSLIAGAGFGLIAAYVNRAFLSGFGERGPGMVGLVNGISGLGLIASPLIFVAAGASIPVTYGAIAILAAAIIPLFRPDNGADPAPAGRPDLFTWRSGVLVLNHVAGWLEAALGGLGAGALIASGWSEAAAAGLVSAFFAAFLLARLSLYWVTRYLPADGIFLTGALGITAATLAASAGWQAAGYVTAGAFVGLIFPSFYVWGTRLLGPDPRVSAAMLLSGLLSGVVGPLLFAGVLTNIGFDRLFGMAAIVAGVVALGCLAMMVPARRITRMAA